MTVVTGEGSLPGDAGSGTTDDLPSEFRALSRRVRNWGRWGDDDRIGTLNLLDPAAVRRGRDAVRTGRCFSLAIPMAAQSIQVGLVPGRFNPIHAMTAINDPVPMGGPFRTSDDILTMSVQGTTHWDGLAHVSYAGQLYNGFSASTVDAGGARQLGIERVKAVVGRGILADVARHEGVDMLAGGRVVTGDDLDGALSAAGIEPAPGDILLIRTGRMRSWVEGGDALAYAAGPDLDGGSPGPGLSAVEWFHDHDIAAVAIDTVTFEVFPSELTDVPLCVHLLDLVDMGLTQGQNWNLEELAADCAADGQYDFLLTANPEPIVGGTGSPVNPVAVK